MLFYLLLLASLAYSGSYAQQCLVEMCDNGWTRYDVTPSRKFCYKAILSGAGVAFSPGQAICHQNDAELASIHTLGEHQFVGNLAHLQDPTNAKTWWLGMRLQWSHGQFLPNFNQPKQVYSWWTDGTQVDFGNANPWMTNEPNGNANASHVGCVFYDATEGWFWDDIDCASTSYANAPFGAVCKLKNLGDCQLPYWAEAGNATVYNNTCYQVIQPPAGGLSHDQAEATCNSLNGTLVSVHSDEENNFVRGLIFATENQAAYAINVAANHHYWTGLSLTHTDPASPILVSDAAWTDGSEVLYGLPIPWAVGGGGGLQPDGPNYPSAVTGAVQLLANGHWNDHTPAATSSGVVCKKPVKQLLGTIVP